MRYLPLLLLSPTWLVLVWLYWMYPRATRVTVARRLYDVTSICLTLWVCVGITRLTYQETFVSMGAFGRQSGEIWHQVKPALCGYGASTALLGIGLLVRGLLWRSRRS